MSLKISIKFKMVMKNKMIQFLLGDSVKILLGSGGIRTNERKRLFFELMKKNFEGCKRIIFVPYASGDYTEYTNSVKELFNELKFDIVGIHELDNP